MADTIAYSPGSLKSMLDALTEYHRVMKGDLGQRVMLGWPRLDGYLRGLRPGQVCGIMARAGVGKTLIACNVVTNIYRWTDPHPVLFFSLEMPAAEIAPRLFCADCGETPERVEAYFSESMGDPKILDWAQKYGNLVIVDEAGLSLEEMEDRYHEAVNRLGQQVPLVIVDYLGMIKGPGSSSYERVSNIARELKNLARRLSCAVVVLIQTSRAGGNGGEPVTLNQARDSGAVEESCDFLLGAWRPELAQKPNSEGELTVSILKNRHGKTGEVAMRFDKQTLRILEADHGS